MLSTKIFTVLAILAVADLASHTAFAAEAASDTPQVRVSYADLDLNAPAGAAVMTTRIHNAARSVCGGGEQAYVDLTQRHFAKLCVQDASSRAAASLHALLVTAMIGGASSSAVQVAAR